MSNDERAVWLAAGLRTPFVGVDGPFAHRDSLALSVPVVQAIVKVSQRRCHEVTEIRFSCAHRGGKDKFRHNMLVHSVGRHTGHINHRVGVRGVGYPGGF
jgi:hypothetical protein